MGAHPPIWRVCGLSSGLQAWVLHCGSWMHNQRCKPGPALVLHLQSWEGLAVLLCRSCPPKYEYPGTSSGFSAALQELDVVAGDLFEVVSAENYERHEQRVVGLLPEREVRHVQVRIAALLAGSYDGASEAEVSSWGHAEVQCRLGDGIADVFEHHKNGAWVSDGVVDCG